MSIAAPIGTVWALLTTAAGLVSWIGPDAIADPVPGGELRWTHPNGATVIGRFVELIPHRCVVFTDGCGDGGFGVPPGSTTVEIDLTTTGDVTTVRLVHRGLPPATVDDHRSWLGTPPRPAARRVDPILNHLV